jgi:hypothetical protein
MKLVDIVQRAVPAPWSEGDSIPWNDREFSQAMLKEHLAQEHDAASYQAYNDDEYRALLEQCGFQEIMFGPSLLGEGERATDFIIIMGHKGCPAQRCMA